MIHNSPSSIIMTINRSCQTFEQYQIQNSPNFFSPFKTRSKRETYNLRCYIKPHFLLIYSVYMLLLLQQVHRVIIRKSSKKIQSYLNQKPKQLNRGMKAYIQIVGQNSPEGPPSLVLHYDSQRYLFNCREGTQRLCVQEKVRLNKLSNVFLTRVNWDCIGGLTGREPSLEIILFNLIKVYHYRYASYTYRCWCT